MNLIECGEFYPVDWCYYFLPCQYFICEKIITVQASNHIARVTSWRRVSKHPLPQLGHQWTCQRGSGPQRKRLGTAWIWTVHEYAHSSSIATTATFVTGPVRVAWFWAPPLQCAALCPSPHSMSPRIIQSILHISIHLEHSLCILNAPPYGIHVLKAIAHNDTRLCSLLEGNVHEYALRMCWTIKWKWAGQEAWALPTTVC
jgi:hypothetical protein